MHSCVSALEKLSKALDEGKPARQVDLSNEERKAVQGLMLLSQKPVIYASNVLDSDLGSGNEYVDRVRAFAQAEGNQMVLVSAQVEAELVDLDDEVRARARRARGQAGRYLRTRTLILWTPRGLAGARRLP